MNQISELFNNFALYESKTFNIYHSSGDKVVLDRKSMEPIYDFLGSYKKEKMQTYCVYCKEKYAFNYDIVQYVLNESRYALCLDTINSFVISLNFNSNLFKYSVNKSKIDSKERTFIKLDYIFHCTNEENHSYSMQLFLDINFKTGDLKITKIGQFPESTILMNKIDPDIETILKSFDALQDYQSSKKSACYGLYSGAYAYLRRVYEKMIKNYLKENNVPIAKSDKISDLIDKIKDLFDIEIQELLKPLYGAISAGIHNIKEEECKEYYDELVTIIDLQLEHEREKLQKSKKLSSCRKKLNEIVQKYKD